MAENDSTWYLDYQMQPLIEIGVSCGSQEQIMPRYRQLAGESKPTECFIKAPDGSLLLVGFITRVEAKRYP